MTLWTSPTYGLRAPADDERVRDGGAAMRRLAGDVDTVLAEQMESVGASPYLVPAPTGASDSALIQGVLNIAAANLADTDSSITVTLQPGADYLTTTTLNLPDRVILNLNGSTITLAPNSNCDVIRSAGFADLTGSNEWWHSDGVPIGFGLVNGRINGGAPTSTEGGERIKTGQTAGRGVSFYGKHYLVHDLTIFDTFGAGFYSECAAYGGQHDVTDLPECIIDGLRVRAAGGHGILYRGPHDGRLDNLFTNECWSSGLIVQANIQNEGTAGGYNGACDVGFIHSYANDVGVKLETTTSVDHMIVESNDAQGLLVSAWENVQVTHLYAYRNQRAPADPDHEKASIQLGVIDPGNEAGDTTRRCVIGHARIRTDYGGCGLQVNGAQNTIGVLQISGADGDGLGLDIAGNSTHIAAATITDYSATGGVGMRLGHDLKDAHVDAEFSNNRLAVEFPTNGTGNRHTLHLAGFVDSGQVGVSGTMGGNTNQIRLAFGGNGTGLTGMHQLAGSGWSNDHVTLGTHHLWVDSSHRLRIKNGAPTSDTDGTVVGAQS